MAADPRLPVTTRPPVRGAGHRTGCREPPGPGTAHTEAAPSFPEGCEEVVLHTGGTLGPSQLGRAGPACREAWGCRPEKTGWRRALVLSWEEQSGPVAETRGVPSARGLGRATSREAGELWTALAARGLRPHQGNQLTPSKAGPSVAPSSPRPLSQEPAKSHLRPAGSGSGVPPPRPSPISARHCSVVLDTSLCLRPSPPALPHTQSKRGHPDVTAESKSQQAPSAWDTCPQPHQ